MSHSKFVSGFAIALASALFLPSAARANAITVYNTGVNPSGNVLAGGSTDPNWVLSGASGSTVVLAPPATPNFGSSWFPDGTVGFPGSSWIGATATNPTPSTPYTFTETFSLTGLNPATATISGVWGISDTGTLSINGQVIDTQSNTVLGGVIFTVPDADLLSGSNTIAITMTSDDGSDDGVRLLFNSATAAQLAGAVPEPSTWTMLILGFAGIGFMAYRRRNAMCTQF
jgi:hypothetical protein